MLKLQILYIVPLYIYIYKCICLLLVCFVRGREENEHISFINNTLRVAVRFKSKSELFLVLLAEKEHLHP